jgi:Sugar (and other) transporter
VSADQSTCNFHIFVGPWSTFSDCDRAQDFLTKAGLSFTKQDTPGKPVSVRIGETTIQGWDAAKWTAALASAGYPKAADPSQINYVMVELILILMVIFVTMVYGPIAAFLVELFPTKIRYTSMSLPYHIGNGWFGGMLPLLATAVVAATGNIYAGLWYPIGIALMSLVIGTLFLRETKDADIVAGSAQDDEPTAPPAAEPVPVRIKA